MSTSTGLSASASVRDQAGIGESKLQMAGILVSRYGLALVLLLIGVLKFTGEEAQGIQPLVANSPFDVLDVRSFERAKHVRCDWHL